MTGSFSAVQADEILDLVIVGSGGFASRFGPDDHQTVEWTRSTVMVAQRI